jgi:hypothetical protein
MALSIEEDVSCYASEAQREVLRTIVLLPLIAENFFITGGTTLSVFYLHHRVSDDIDFFSIEFHELNQVDTILKRAFQRDLSLIQSSPEFYSYLIRGVKVDFVFDSLSTSEERPLVNLETGGKVFVDTLANMASNKLAALASRSEAKDLIDFYFIGRLAWTDSREESFLGCCESARRKEALFDDPPTAAYQIERLHDRVLRQGLKALPPMKRPIDWSSFREDFRFYIDTLYGMANW